MISFAPLWRTMERKKITQYQLIQKYYVSTGTLDALRKNRSVTLDTRPLHNLVKKRADS